MNISTSGNCDGNRFSDDQVMAWFKIGATIPGLEETRATIPKTAGGYIKEDRPPAEPGLPLTIRKPSRHQREFANMDNEREAPSSIQGLNIKPYHQSLNTGYGRKLNNGDLPMVSLGLPKYPVKSTTLTSKQNLQEFYSRYSFDHKYSKELPITEKRQTILDTINHSPVTIIQGETGSGKTTQVPQYILDQYAKQMEHCNIICTQPRRIATTSIAKFICKERSWQLGNLVGYQIQLDKRTSEDTRLTFCTTGVLLQHLVNKRNLNEYTHVILDEVSNTKVTLCYILINRFMRETKIRTSVCFLFDICKLSIHRLSK